MIPKEHTENIVAADPELVKYMLGKVKMLSEKLGVSEKGFRIVVNTGDEGGQTVHHLHIHLWRKCSLASVLIDKLLTVMYN